MSFNIRSIREISTDPTTKFISHLAKRISDLQNASQQEDLENKEDIYSAGQDIESVVGFHSDLTSTNQFTFDKEYYPPTEPDADKVKLWLKGYNMGSSLKDWSGFDNENTVNGDPVLADGSPFDYGIHSGGIKSRCLRFNRPNSEYENEEYIKITDVAELRVTITSSFSIFMRVRPKSIAQQGGQAVTLFEKIDDSTPNNAMMLQISDTGRLYWIVKESGVDYAWQTATSTIAVNTVYDIWVTYNGTGNAMKVYVNNVDKSLTSYGGAINWQSDLTNHDLFIGKRGQGSDGHVYMDFYDWLYYRNMVVSAAQVGYHYTNKWTIADIPFGQVMVSDYWATYDPDGPPGGGGVGYDTTGFDSTGYD